LAIVRNERRGYALSQHLDATRGPCAVEFQLQGSRTFLRLNAIAGILHVVQAEPIITSELFRDFDVGDDKMGRVMIG
jgi:hypothetical protein